MWMQMVDLVWRSNCPVFRTVSPPVLRLKRQTLHRYGEWLCFAASKKNGETNAGQILVPYFLVFRISSLEREEATLIERRSFLLWSVKSWEISWIKHISMSFAGQVYSNFQEIFIWNHACYSDLSLAENISSVNCFTPFGVSRAGHARAPKHA